MKNWKTVNQEINDKLKLGPRDKCFYTEFNYYNEPAWEIIEYKEINREEFPGCNSDGIWGRKESGVMKN